MGRPVIGVRSLVIGIATMAALTPQLAQASDTSGSGSAETTSSGLLVTGVDTEEPQESTGESTTEIESASSTSSLPPGAWVKSEACDTVAASGCVVEYTCSDGSAPQVWTYVLTSGETAGSYSQCPEDPPPTAETTPTATVDIPGEVLNAFKRVALPESTINVQPPGGETLVNLPTILSTSAERHQVPVHLDQVNIDVLLEVWPSRFVWHHGDDTSQETTVPGKAWTEGADLADLITHTYAKTSEELDLSVDTTWSAQFRVVGQPNWRPVDGTVTIGGTPVTVAVLEAKPQLVR